jgi:hypothetical protein
MKNIMILLMMVLEVKDLSLEKIFSQWIRRTRYKLKNYMILFFKHFNQRLKFKHAKK